MGNFVMIWGFFDIPSLSSMVLVVPRLSQVLKTRKGKKKIIVVKKRHIFRNTENAR
jgi:hypothetical protein